MLPTPRWTGFSSGGLLWPGSLLDEALVPFLFSQQPMPRHASTVWFAPFPFDMSHLPALDYILCYLYYK